MPRYIEAPKGKMFALTEFGLEKPHVRGKFEENYVHRIRYEHNVPTAWWENGYVQLIERRVADES